MYIKRRGLVHSAPSRKTQTREPESEQRESSGFGHAYQGCDEVRVGFASSTVVPMDQDLSEIVDVNAELESDKRLQRIGWGNEGIKVLHRGAVPQEGAEPPTTQPGGGRDLRARPRCALPGAAALQALRPSRREYSDCVDDPASFRHAALIHPPSFKASRERFMVSIPWQPLEELLRAHYSELELT